MQDQQDTERQRIESEIDGDGYALMFTRLRRRHPFLLRYGGWSDVLGFMRAGTARDSGKDEILRPILRAYRKDRDPRWCSILLAFFWPGLACLSWKKRKLERDPEERWQNILCAFLRAVRGIAISRRPAGLVQGIFNGTVHRLYDLYRGHQEPRRRKRLPRNLPVHDEGQVLLEIGDLQETALAELRGYLAQGWITQNGLHVIFETRAKGRGLKAYARETGLTLQAAKKRRRRAERGIRKHRDRWLRKRQGLFRSWKGALTP